MVEHLTEKIAGFVADTRFEDIPERCIEIAERQIIDYVGVNIAGSVDRSSEILREFVLENGTRGECTILGTSTKVSAGCAALVNGMQSHCLDYDDVNQSMYGHPTTAILPALFAVAERNNYGGKELLEAYILGVEVAAKIGTIINPMHYELGWHATSTLGSIGAAVGVAKILDFKKGEIQKTLGLAASLAGGLSKNFGTMTKPLHAGTAAENGVKTALLVKKGWTADPYILDSASGFYRAFSGGFECFPEKIEPLLGNPFDMVSPGIIVKKYPSCAFTHPAIDAVLELTTDISVSADDIEQIIVGINKTASKILAYRSATTDLEAKFSIEYCVASALLRRSCALAHFTVENVLKDDVQRTIQKVSRVLIPTVPGIENIFGPSDVLITCKNGKQYRKRVEIAKGDPRKPLSDEEVFDKYKDCLSCLYDDKIIEKSYRIIRGMRSLAHIGDLLQFF
jgi:2-methylcitrate dehydratase PrpD